MNDLAKAQPFVDQVGIVYVMVRKFLAHLMPPRPGVTQKVWSALSPPLRFRFILHDCQEHASDFCSYCTMATRLLPAIDVSYSAPSAAGCGGYLSTGATKPSKYLLDVVTAHLHRSYKLEGVCFFFKISFFQPPECSID